MADQATTHDDDGTDTDRVLPFAGTTRFDRGEVPPRVMDYGSSMRWWAVECGADDDTPIGHDELPDAGLHTRIDELPRASTADVAWKNPVTGEWQTTGKHNAVVEPSRVEELARREADAEDGEAVEHPGDSALFNIPTDDYEIINPAQFLRPLAEVLQEESLSDSVFGEFRLHRDGGRVSADVLFDGKHVEHPDIDEDRKPIVTGLQLDWDFFGDTALRMQGVGIDYECVNAIRNITETKIIKHAGDVESRVDWRETFREMLEQIDLKTDQLSQLIAEATEQTLDVSELPDGMLAEYDSVLAAFYAYSGLPDYLAQTAANNCRAEAEDPFEPTWWDIHRGATYAITHEGRGEVGTGGAIERYNRLANDMLTNPAAVADQVEREYEAAHEDEDLAEEAGGLVDIQNAFESVRDKRERYEEREDEIQALVQAD